MKKFGLVLGVHLTNHYGIRFIVYVIIQLTHSTRPLAYSTLADLVHHIRQELSLNQLARVVFLYTKNLHDSSLPFSIQTMSVKLLLHLVEFIPRRNDPNDTGKGSWLTILIY